MPDAYRLDRDFDTGDEQAPIDESSATDTGQRESFGRRFRRLVSGLRDSSFAQSLLSRRPWVILLLVLVYFAVYPNDLRVITSSVNQFKSLLRSIWNPLPSIVLLATAFGGGFLLAALLLRRRDSQF